MWKNSKSDKGKVILFGNLAKTRWGIWLQGAHSIFYGTLYL